MKLRDNINKFSSEKIKFILSVKMVDENTWKLANETKKILFEKITNKHMKEVDRECTFSSDEEDKENLKQLIVNEFRRVEKEWLKRRLKKLLIKNKK